MVPQTSKYSDVFVHLTLKLQYQKMTIRVVASITSNTEIHFIFYLDCFPASSFCDWVCFIPFCSSSVSYMSVIRLLLYVSSVSKKCTYLPDWLSYLDCDTNTSFSWLTSTISSKKESFNHYFLLAHFLELHSKLLLLCRACKILWQLWHQSRSLRGFNGRHSSLSWDSRPFRSHRMWRIVYFELASLLTYRYRCFQVCNT